VANYYRHSGTTPLGGLLACLVATLAISVPLAVAYAYATAYVPIVHASVLMTLGLGAGIGYIAFRLSKIGKIRNSTLPALVAAFSGLAALYVAWGADFLARAGFAQFANPAEAFDPATLWAYIQWYYANGQWTIGRGGGQAVSGIPLAIVWIVEAIVIVGLAFYLAKSQMGKIAFCENCDAWMDVVNDLRRFSVQGADALKRLIETGDVAALAGVLPAQPNDGAFLRMNLHCCDFCTESNYVDIDQVVISVDKNGNQTEKVQSLISKIGMTAQQVEQIRDWQPPAPGESAAAEASA
jgi:hypothetical protein